MIPATNTVAAVVPAHVETTSAKIKLNAEMFSLLSDKMYSNKIQAVIREISCNASDAMKASGKADVPIHVHLPTAFEAWFSVKDTGLGLSHDQVMDMYLTYGESTKSTSNSQTGGFGIGSKVPFAYTESFTVTSVFEGERNIYSIYRDEGIPKVTHLGGTETTDCNGVEVKVPVQSGDATQFQHEASIVYSVFDVEPNMNTYITLNTLEPYEGVDKLQLMNKEGWGDLKIIMGQVMYSIEDTIEGVRILSELSKVAGKTTILSFEIGELSPAPSREQLSNDKATVSALEARISEVTAELISSYQVQVDACNTDLETYRCAEEFPETIRKALTYDSGSYQQLKVDAQQHIKDYVEATLGRDTIVYHREAPWSGKGKVNNVKLHSVGHLLCKGLLSGNGVDFLIADKVGGVTPFKKYIRKDGFGLTFKTEVELDTFLSELEIKRQFVNVHLASDLKDKVSRKKRDMGKVKLLHEDSHFNWGLKEVAPNLDKHTKTVYYVLARAHGCLFDGDYDSQCSTTKHLMRSRNINTVYVLTSQQVKTFSKETNKLELLTRKVPTRVESTFEVNFKRAFVDTKMPQSLYDMLNSAGLMTQAYKKEYLLSKLKGYKVKGNVDVAEVGYYKGALGRMVEIMKAELYKEYAFIDTFTDYNGYIDTQGMKYVKALIKAQKAGEL